MAVLYHRDHPFIALFLLDYGLGFLGWFFGSLLLFVCLLLLLLLVVVLFVIFLLLVSFEVFWGCCLFFGRGLYLGFFYVFSYCF